MAVSGDTLTSFAEVEGRIFEIEERLLELRLPERTRPIRPPRPVRRSGALVWGLTTLLAIVGSAAVIGPFLLILTS